jgi:hypothetical protein
MQNVSPGKQQLKPENLNWKKNYLEIIFNDKKSWKSPIKIF